MRPFATFATAFCATLAVSTGHGAAPQVRTQAPGYYRMMLGDFEITALSDGTMDLPVDQLLTNIEPERLTKMLAREHLQAPVEASVNAFLINTGAKLVLVDSGAGTFFGPTLARLPANLQAAGYAPEQIDDIVITHLHGDHIGGLIADGKRAFPNATVHVDKHDADFWLSQANQDKAPADRKDSFKGAMTAMRPYQNAGKFHVFEAGAQIVPGVKSVAAHGHTPGHTLYSVESQGRKLMLWGDLMHVAAVQFPDPAVTIKFDSDSPAARTQREKAFADAAAQGYWVGVAHLPFPGIGHIRADGKGYAWVPANYTTNRPPKP